jgi:hypothetical protein
VGDVFLFYSSIQLVRKTNMTKKKSKQKSPNFYYFCHKKPL